MLCAGSTASRGGLMLNKVIIMGRLTKDPELRYTQSGVAVASFAIACERDIKGADGNRETDFIDVAAWRSTGEFISKYFAKGNMIALSGRLQERQWTDSNGGKRRTYEIVADTAYFAEGKRPDGVQERTNAVNISAGDFTDLEDADGELPF